jgi:signal transduction histidine kinase
MPASAGGPYAPVMGTNVRRLAVDAGVVAVLAAATAVSTELSSLALGGETARGVEKVAQVLGGQAAWRAELTRWWAATAIGMLALLVRGRLPLVALAGGVAMSLVHVSSQAIPLLPLDIAAAVALFSVAAEASSRWLSYGALLVTTACAFAPALKPTLLGPSPLGLPPPTWGSTLLPPTIVVLAWMFGDRTRISRAYLEQAKQRAHDLERERDQQGELAAAAERSRISRELHDAVAHGLSVIVIQAQAASGAMGERPAVARAALAAIVATGRDSLTEMRRLLGLSRPDGAALAPLPGLADLPGLVERVRAAGLPVRVSVTGEVAELPTGIGLSAYRIAQEALTNALKHAGPAATVDVEVSCGPAAVELTVADTGRGAGGVPDERRGSGLRGMRERVAMLGGTLTACDRPGGGFQVSASLPVAAT